MTASGLPNRHPLQNHCAPQSPWDAGTQGRRRLTSAAVSAHKLPVTESPQHSNRGTPSRARRKPRRSPESRELVKLVAWFAVFAAAIAVGVGAALYERNQEEQVLKHGVTTQGTPISIEEGRTNKGFVAYWTIVYEYDVDGTAYKVAGERFDRRSDAQAFRDDHPTVTVYYDAGNPDTAYAPAG